MRRLLPVFTSKRTIAGLGAMSQRCQKRTVEHVSPGREAPEHGRPDGSVSRMRASLVRVGRWPASGSNAHPGTAMARQSALRRIDAGQPNAGAVDFERVLGQILL